MQRQPVQTQKDSDEGVNQTQSIAPPQNKARKNQRQNIQRIVGPTSMQIKFSGCIRSGYFKQFQSLAVFYTISANQNNWKHIAGQKSGFSQVSSSPQGRIIWNFPFQIEYGLNTFHESPQMYIVLYGYDFFGRSIAKAYGNIHLPINAGPRKRTMRTFRMNQNSIWRRLWQYMSGAEYQFKEVQKVFKKDEQRSSLRVQSSGDIEIEFDTKRQLFQRYGYE